MSTHENITGDIKQIFDAFDNFINLYELNKWLKNASLEDFKSSFKLCKFIEESVKKLQLNECGDVFKLILVSWWKSKNRTKIYDLEFFNLASDRLLSQFFTNKFVTITSVDVAVRIYTSMYAKERFEAFLTNLILKSASYEAIIDSTISNKANINLKELECRLLLRNWSVEVESGRISEVKCVIANMLSSYKIETSLLLLIQILSLKDLREGEKAVKKIIIKFVKSKMIDRSILSKHFWLSLFKNVDKEHLSEVCVEYHDFLKELFDFMVYIGCMMNSDPRDLKNTWKGDPSISICPEITCNDLVELIRFITNYNLNIRNYGELRITQAKSCTNSLLWQQIAKDLCWY